MKKRKKQGNYQLKSTPCPFKAITSNTTPQKNNRKQKKKNNTHKKPKTQQQQKSPNKQIKKKPKYNYVWYLQSYLKKNYNS